MKRGLILTLCALAVATAANVGHAQTIDLALNLRYNDPADPSEGGVWYLMAKTNTGGGNLGIAGVSAWLTGSIGTTVFHGTGVTLPAGQNPAFGAYSPSVGQATTNNLTNGTNPYNGVFGVATNVLYGQNTSVAGIIGGVGQGLGTAGNIPVDPLRNPTFNNYAALVSGTFSGATRPGFSQVVGSVSGGNVLTSLTPSVSGGSIAATVVTTSPTIVRGDSLSTLGLNSTALSGSRPGDMNRDGTTDIGDFSVLQLNFNQSPRFWDTGDVNDDGSTDIGDFSVIQLNFNQSAPAPVTAVPEPASLAMAGLSAIFGAAFVARRRRN